MHPSGTQRPSEVIGGNTSFYTIYTLIDITDSNVSSPKINEKKFYQSQNLNTFMQVIGLRTQPIISSIIKLETQDTAAYNFGTGFTSNQTVWVLKFVSDTDRAWYNNGSFTALLLQDFNLIPIHDQLDETATIDGDIINTNSEEKTNTYFSFSENI
jgi:hypothetical protein